MNTSSYLFDVLKETFPGDWKAEGAHFRMTNGSVTVCVSIVFDTQPGAMCHRHNVTVNGNHKSVLYADEVPRTIRTLIEDRLSPFATDFGVWFGGHTARSIIQRYRDSTARMISDHEKDLASDRARLKAYDEILEKLGGGE